MNGVGKQLQAKRKSLRPKVSVEKLARTAGVSAASVKRAESDHPSVSQEMFESLQVALAVLDGERRRQTRPAPPDVVGEIEQHARAILDLAKQLRGGE